MAADEVVIFGVGDVGPIHEPMDQYATLVKPAFDTADIRIGICERTYSDRGDLQVHSGVHERPLKPSMTSIYTECNFDVVSLAGNHGMDWGPDALMDTVDLINARGIRTVGAGRNLAEARAPAILEKKGIKVAVLGYCSILKAGYEAGPNKPGIAPLRVHTYYEPMEYQAGMPPKVITVAYEEDLNNLIADVRAAKKQADIVVLSLHWGLHFIPRAIADYQPVVAKAAFEAGADIIMGHHAHAPKAVQVIDGKVCFHSLSNFIMTTHMRERLAAKEGKTVKEALAGFAKKYGVVVNEDDPLPYGTDSQRTMIAKAVATKQGIRRVSFLPCLIDQKLRPEVLRAGDRRFDDQLKFMEWVSEDFNHRFAVEGDEIVVTG